MIPSFVDPPAPESWREISREDIERLSKTYYHLYPFTVSEFTRRARARQSKFWKRLFSLSQR